MTAIGAMYPNPPKGIAYYLTPFRREVMAAVIEHGAQEARCLSYRQVAEAINRPTMLGHWLAYPLGDISRWCHRAGLPLLSSIVVSEHSEEPSEGFWHLVDGLYKVRPIDRAAFLVNMQTSVFAVADWIKRAGL
jgi:hypothetical protein